MENVYLGFTFNVKPLQPASEILIAELGNVGFESFVETETGVNAYILKNDWNSNILDDIYILNSNEFSIDYSFEEIEQVNWNEEWEKNFDPIVVDDMCSVRAPFHDKPNVEFDIVIEPKMSFGTGHHETTHLMIQHLLELNLKGKKTLDMGCGTGVLAILASMRGANPVEAIDIDNWCYLNTLENVERNKIANITVAEGDSTLLKNKEFDVVIANINRNILLSDISIYASTLGLGSSLLLSGFYVEDLALIKAECGKYDLKYVSHKVKNNWVAAHFERSSLNL